MNWNNQPKTLAISRSNLVLDELRGVLHKDANLNRWEMAQKCAWVFKKCVTIILEDGWKKALQRLDKTRIEWQIYPQLIEDFCDQMYMIYWTFYNPEVLAELHNSLLDTISLLENKWLEKKQLASWEEFMQNINSKS